jgi:DNA-binding MarR family transcriptional regulator
LQQNDTYAAFVASATKIGHSWAMTDHHLCESHVTAWIRLTRVSQSCMEGVEADLKAAGFPPLVWYDVLLELRRAPEERLRNNEIGGKILLSKSNVTRVVDRLEAKGLVRREDCAEDRRGAFVAITEEGRDLQARMWPVYRESLTRRFGERLTEREARQLGALLAKLGSETGKA